MVSSGLCASVFQSWDQKHTMCFVPARFYQGIDREAPTVITGKFPSVSRQIRKGLSPTSALIPNSLCFLPRACAFQSPPKQCLCCSHEDVFHWASKTHLQDTLTHTWKCLLLPLRHHCCPNADLSSHGQPTAADSWSPVLTSLWAPSFTALGIYCSKTTSKIMQLLENTQTPRPQLEISMSRSMMQ